MSATKANEVKETKQPVKRAEARKVNPEERVVTRETRVPLGGFTGPLTLQNQDPDTHYYWEMDDAVDGAKIERRLQAGYTFCRPEENLVAGSTTVFETVHSGSVIRVPAGGGAGYLYLMKIPLDWYNEDMERHAKRVDMTEDSLQSQSSQEGFYGGLKFLDK